MIVYAQGDITKFDVDAIVNASNGFGYMGGKDVLMNYIEELQRAFNLHLAVLLNGLQEQNVRHTPFLVIHPELFL